ncbi:SAM hydrolase/SAM-dependent halogenase family protein [Actinomadura parmotrematis]|uniref:SAM-dependent chlorinase/fluorinase n=1 Tax=Actinomadura parmotrematis TaxID=2864039 RepID=A0ABS7G370_9ACTN|nr:SAM-dependent chlorinase/fluorinase [Actinomadura parmotrematis]MBW8486098.1 SAM-dependent chlorinase/fluorinase [Actinomadura parmotrematis]
MSRPYISLATDFGAAYTGICAGVVHRIAPDARVHVLSDEITPYAVAEGAMLLAQALPYLPVGVHVGIVDPGVGTARHPVGVRTGRGDVLVGPDNGLLAPAAAALGGALAAHRLEDPAYRLPEVSTSFHGRDVFAPAAAHLANGADLADLGPATGLLPLDVPPPRAHEGTLITSVLYADRYGSLILSAGPAELGEIPHGTVLRVSWDGGGVRAPFVATFGSVAEGEPLLWIDSSGLLGLAVNRGSAAERFGLGAGAPVTVEGLGPHG